jgi:hypothetical protein
MTLFISQVFIFCIQFAVLLVIDWIVQIISQFSLGSVFSADYRLRQIVPILILTKLEPFMLNNSRPQGITVCVVYSRISLKIRNIQYIVFEPHRTALKMTEEIVEVSIKRPCVKHSLCDTVQLHPMFQLSLTSMPSSIFSTILGVPADQMP